MSPRLSPADGAALLPLARAAIAAWLQRETLPLPADLPAALYARGAAFVTLRLHGDLRGCIGTLEARDALAQCVIDHAVRAAGHDPRFSPLTAAEFPRLHLEVSCLTPLVPVAGPAAVVVGQHGVVLTCHGQRAVFLPQVATEQGWDRTTLLRALARKAGLAADAWCAPAARYEVFEAQVFAEPE